MGTRKANFAQGEYYHIYNRGNNKQKIFHNDGDYSRFIKILYLANSINSFKFRDVANQIYEVDRGDKLVDIGAYCLMPNHFHLLIKETNENKVSKFMQKLTTAYSMYYNTKYPHTGGLFEGKFKSQHVDDDNYLKYLFSYIHLNPIKLIDSSWKKEGIKNKSKALKFLESYSYSSYLDFLNKQKNRPEYKILNINEFPEYFPTDRDFVKEAFEWISFNENTPV